MRAKVTHPMMSSIFFGPLPCCSKYNEWLSNGSPACPRITVTGHRPLRVQVAGLKIVGKSACSLAAVAFVDMVGRGVQINPAVSGRDCVYPSG